jgi:hypothetical protein
MRSVFSLHRLEGHQHIKRGSLSTSAHLGLVQRQAAKGGGVELEHKRSPGGGVEEAGQGHGNIEVQA